MSVQPFGASAAGMLWFGGGGGGAAERGGVTGHTWHSSGAIPVWFKVVWEQTGDGKRSRGNDFLFVVAVGEER